jgi:transposase
MIINDKTHYCSVANNKDGFKEFAKWIRSHKVDKIKACMESTGIYSLAFADYLSEQGHQVSIVNPACINAFAKSKLSRHKTDKIDSKIIAEYASKYELKPYVPTDHAILNLRNLYDCIDNLENQHRKLQNYLEAREHLSFVVIKTYEKLCSHLLREIEKLENEIESLLNDNAALKEDIDNIQTIPGIGKKTAMALLTK